MAFEVALDEVTNYLGELYRTHMYTHVDNKATAPVTVGTTIVGRWAWR